MKKITVILLFICTVTAFAQDARTPLQIELPTIRSYRADRSFSPNANNFLSLLMNPASIMQEEQQSFYTLSPIIDLNKFDINKFNGSIMFNMKEDVVMPVGFAMRIWGNESHNVDVGISANPLIRVMSMGQPNHGMTDIYSMELISVPVMNGIGFDLGFMYQWDAGLNAGITLKDIGAAKFFNNEAVTDSNDSTYFIPFTLNLGVAYDFKLGDFWQAVPTAFANTGITFAFEWKDFINVFMQKGNLNLRDAFLDIGVGMQVKMLDTFMLSFGMRDMMPAYGIGFDLGPLQLDMAYYGKEFGNEGGQHMSAFDFTVTVRPEAKPRTWPWTQRSIANTAANGSNSNNSVFEAD